MTKFASLILIFVFSVFAVNMNAEIKNENKPLKGEWDFQPQPVWEVESAGDDVLSEARAIHPDDNGNVFLFEGKHRKFFAFAPDGKFLYSFGKTGEGPGEYKLVFDFFLVGNYVIAPDQGKIHYFTRKGEFVKSANPGVLFFPRLFIDENRFITVDEVNEKKKQYEKLEIYDLDRKSRSALTEITAEKSLTASAESEGRQMTLVIKIGDITPVVVITLHQNLLYYGKNDNYLVKKIDLNGKELLAFSLQGRKQKEITREYKKKRIDQIKLNGGAIPADMAKQMIDGMPDYAPYFNRITIEENGLIYVFMNDPANETGLEIDIFSPEGKYLYHGRLTLPGGLIKAGGLEIKGNFLWAFTEDNDGERKLVKYKIVKPSI